MEFYDHGDPGVDREWLIKLNRELDAIQIPEFFLPPLDSLRECKRMIDRKELDHIFCAAIFEHLGMPDKAEARREAAGYGGLD